MPDAEACAYGGYGLVSQIYHEDEMKMTDEMSCETSPGFAFPACCLALADPSLNH